MSITSPYCCFACRETYLKLPEKCSFCGERMFINLNHTVYCQDMYPDRSEPKKKESIFKRAKSGDLKEKDAEEYDMFTGFVLSDHEDDVDLFGGLETEANLITLMDVPLRAGESAVMKGEFTVTELRLVHFNGVEMPYVLTAENQQTGEVVRVRNCEWNPCSFVNYGLISFETVGLSLQAQADSHWIVKIYCDLNAQVRPNELMLKGLKKPI